MAFTFADLDLSGVDVSRGGRTLSPGRYACRIVEAEMKPTKSGFALRLQFSEVGGAGTISDFINVKNTSEQAERIGRERLKSMLKFAGHPNPDRPGDVASLRGLVVGLYVDEGEEFINDKGEKVKAAGKIRKSGAYFPAKDMGVAVEAAAPSRDLDDEIPF